MTALIVLDPHAEKHLMELANKKFTNLHRIRQSMLKLPTHSGFHDLFLNFDYLHILLNRCTFVHNAMIR
jgi:hypothetical protein